MDKNFPQDAPNPEFHPYLVKMIIPGFLTSYLDETLDLDSCNNRLKLLRMG